MTVILTIVFSLATAFTNAVSATLQWHAAARVPEDQAKGLRLVGSLARRPEYLASIGALTASFLLQAAALRVGELALVQPLLVTELPFTIMLAAAWFRVGVDRREVAGTVAVCAGLGVFLGVGRPYGGRTTAPAPTWLAAAGVVLVIMVALVLVARSSGRLRATVGYALASGLAFSITALLVKATTSRITGGIVHLFAGWEAWAMFVAGITAVLLQQRAMHAGSLAAAKPASTIVNPLASVVLGVVVFHEALEGGPAVVAEVAGMAILAAGIVELTRSPLVSGRPEELRGWAGARPARRRPPGESGTGGQLGPDRRAS